jgi:WD40 repeat protein
MFSSARRQRCCAYAEVERGLIGYRPSSIRFAALTFKAISPFTPHREAVLALDIGWAGAERHMLLASGGGDNCVRVHSLMTSELMFELDGHVEPVTSVAFSSEGVYLASASRDGTIALWSTISGCQLWLFVGHCGAVNALTFVPSIEERLLSAGDDASIREWSLKTGKQKRMW